MWKIVNLFNVFFIYFDNVVLYALAYMCSCLYILCLHIMIFLFIIIFSMTYSCFALYTHFLIENCYVFLIQGGVCSIFLVK